MLVLTVNLDITTAGLQSLGCFGTLSFGHHRSCNFIILVLLEFLALQVAEVPVRVQNMFHEVQLEVQNVHIMTMIYYF